MQADIVHAATELANHGESNGLVRLLPGGNVGVVKAENLVKHHLDDLNVCCRLLLYYSPSQLRGR